MKSFEQQDEPKKGVNKVFIVALIFAISLAAALIWASTLMPASEERKAEVLENVYREGSPEFENLFKKIIVYNNADRMTQARTGFGTIVMNLTGTISNRTGKTITGLEVKAGMINSNNDVIKDKTLIIVPKEIETLENNQTREVTISIDGFKEDDDRANAFWKVTAIRTE